MLTTLLAAPLAGGHLIQPTVNLKLISVDNAEFAAGVKQSAKISFDDDVVPTRRVKAITSVTNMNNINNVDKNNALNLEERINDMQDSNIKIEGNNRGTRIAK